MRKQYVSDPKVFLPYGITKKLFAKRYRDLSVWGMRLRREEVIKHDIELLIGLEM